MSDADWEREEFGFQRIRNDKWEGEDEDDDVKDNWEDEEEEKKDLKQEEDPASSIRAFQKKKKRPIAEIIAEKEAQKEKLKEEELVPKVEAPPLDPNAEKLRQRRLQEESDLKLAKEAFGLTDGIDQMSPESEDDFIKFEEALKNKITNYEKSPHYAAFLDKLFTDLIINVESEEIRKINASLSSMYHEKLKQQKEVDKKKKKKNKASIKYGKENDLDAIRYDDFGEDFM
ncbi:eukaryotic translation initiation factor 3 subunit J-A-like [Argonauta hians]